MFIGSIKIFQFYKKNKQQTQYYTWKYQEKRGFGLMFILRIRKLSKINLKMIQYNFLFSFIQFIQCLQTETEWIGRHFLPLWMFLNFPEFNS